MKPVRIAKAWKKRFIHTDEEKKIADERLEVCKACPNRQLNEYFQFYECGICLCPLTALIYDKVTGCKASKWSR